MARRSGRGLQPGWPALAVTTPARPAPHTALYTLSRRGAADSVTCHVMCDAVIALQALSSKAVAELDKR